MLGPRIDGFALVLVGAALLLGCNDKPAGAAVDSPDAAGAGAEARSQRPSSAHATLTGGATARSVVAVASVNAAQAQPCERTCGRIGDCLLGGDEVNAFEAGRLELECLDLCVHTPESPVRTAFLGCEQKSGCGELLGCARAQWEPLAATHAGPAVQGIAGRASDPCRDGCRWLFSCLNTGAPPDEAYLSPEYEEQLRYCEAQCDSMGELDREFWARVAECAPSHCSQVSIGDCLY